MIAGALLQDLTLSRRWLMYPAGLALTAVLLGLLLTGQGTLLVVLLFALPLIALVFYHRDAAIFTSLAYITLMGDIRRIRDLLLPHSSLDMLILIEPMAVILLGAPLFLRARPKDPLSKAMFWLLLLMAVEIFNPLQGGLSVGVGGALFYLIPLFWFWIGRQYGSIRVTRTFIYRVLMPLCLLAGALGLYQNFVGFTPWEQMWIDANRATFVILNLGGGNSRSFGFSNSPAEFAYLVGLGGAAGMGAWFAGRRIWALAVPPLVAAMFYASGRAVVVKLLFAIVFLFAVRRTGRLKATTLLRLVLLLLGSFGLLSYIAGRFVPSGGGAAKSTAQAAVVHQVQGLANPFDEKQSTVGTHSAMMFYGIRQGFLMPIGRGLGSTTAAASKFGGTSFSSEVDFSDTFLSLGLVGGCLYLYIIFQVVMECVAYLRFAPRDVGLPVLAIILSGIGSWLIGGQYSTCAIWMFLIGCVAHRHLASEARSMQFAAVPTAPAALQGS